MAYDARSAGNESSEMVGRPHTWFSVVGIGWAAGAGLEGVEPLGRGEFPYAFLLLTLGAATPLAVLRFRGPAPLERAPTWVVGGAAFLAGLVVAILTATELLPYPRLLVPYPRVLLPILLGLDALAVACGLYVVTRTMDALPAERKALYTAVGVSFVARVAALLLGGPLLFGRPPSALPSYALQMTALIAVLLVIATLVPWTYVRFLRVRRALTPVADVFGPAPHEPPPSRLRR